MPDRSSTIAVYTAASTLTAITLAYVFGPSLFPNVDYRSSGRKGVVGLRNTANDCFINAVLQALAGIKDFRSYLDIELSPIEDSLENDRNVQEHATSGHTAIVSRAFRTISNRLTDPLSTSNTISARTFIQSLESSTGRRLNRRQQDAQEFLQFIVETFHDEQVALQKQLAINSARQTTSKFPFEGKLESQIECLTCHSQPKTSISSFLTLSLNVPQQSTTSLDQCFDDLLKMEFIDDFTCYFCRLDYAYHIRQNQATKTSSDVERDRLEDAVARIAKALEEKDEDFDPALTPAENKAVPKRRISKHTRIVGYPDVLAVHLSRSVFETSGFSRKNTAKVTFNERLCLGGFHRRFYKLATLITHLGGHDSGHYESFRRQIQEVEACNSKNTQSEVLGEATTRNTKSRQSNKWWRISDDKIKEGRTSDVLAMQKEVYLLFFERDLEIQDIKEKF